MLNTITDDAAALSKVLGVDHTADPNLKARLMAISVRLCVLTRRGVIDDPKSFIFGKEVAQIEAQLKQLAAESSEVPIGKPEVTDATAKEITDAIMEEYKDVTGPDKARVHNIATKAGWAVARGEITIEDLCDKSLAEIEQLVDQRRNA